MDHEFKGLNLKNVAEFLKKWKIPVLLAVLGVGILLFPDIGSKEECNPVTVNEIQTCTEEKIEEILSKVEGAGEVRVMLTQKNDGWTEYQTDKETFIDNSREEQRTETVFHGEQALVRCKTLPEYQGAVVVCQGGNNPNVCLKLIDALCSLTGLTSDKITVLKMK